MSQLNDAQVRKIVRQYVASNLEAADNDFIKNLKIDIDRSSMSLKVTADAKMLQPISRQLSASRQWTMKLLPA
ncbi:MAG: hypothetical protein R3D34_02220 [Nitratireductor sp.]